MAQWMVEMKVHSLVQTRVVVMDLLTGLVKGKMKVVPKAQVMVVTKADK